MKRILAAQHVAWHHITSHHHQVKKVQLVNGGGQSHAKVGATLLLCHKRASLLFAPNSPLFQSKVKSHCNEQNATCNNCIVTSTTQMRCLGKTNHTFGKAVRICFPSLPSFLLVSLWYRKIRHAVMRGPLCRCHLKFWFTVPLCHTLSWVQCL